MRRNANSPPPSPPESAPASHLKPLDDAGQRRVSANLGLAYKLGWQFARRYARDLPADELIAEALYALTYAAGLYDPARNVPFPAYAALVIRHRLINAIREWRRGRRREALPPGHDPDSGHWEAEYPTTVDIPTAAAAGEMCDLVRRVLPPRLFDALRLYHAEGHSMDEIGGRLGVSKQRVSRMLVQAIDQVRKRFPDW